jgi:putative membrane protein
MYYFNDFYPSSMFGLGPLFMFIFWALIVYGAIVLFKGIGSKQNGVDRSVEILKERYAKGEITKVQFDAMKKDLQ